jgi:hypothetical protein
MMEHGLGLRTVSGNTEKFTIDSDYFSAFEAMKSILSHNVRGSGQVRESGQNYITGSSTPNSNTAADEQPIDLKPEDDLISLSALGYALRVDPMRVRRWVENETLRPDVFQTSGDRTSYYFRRDRIEQIRQSFSLESIPASSDEWKQEFLDFAKSRNLTKSYKPVMLKAFFKLVDREGKVKIDDLVKEFRGYYVQRVSEGRPLERSASPLSDPTRPSDHEIKRLIITYPLERFLIKNFIEYFPEEGILRMASQLWQALHYYEVVDTLKMADEQIEYYYARSFKKDESDLS